MTNDSIAPLLEALQLSPDNVPLRFHVATMLAAAGSYHQSIDHYKEILRLQPDHAQAKIGLGTAYFHEKKFSAAVILFEQASISDFDIPPLVLYIKALLKENSIGHATDLYKEIIARNPSFSDAEIDGILRHTSSGQQVGLNTVDDLDDMINDGSEWLMEKPDIRFADVGGMEKVKSEISLKIIQPLKNPELYKAFGKKIGGGILLYGPPGCGKTFIARATAGEINANFISVGLHDILDMWIGNSEKNLHDIFEVARRNAPSVLFFDEVDAIGASRSDMKHSAMRHVINQFLAEMDGVSSSNDGVLVLAATNAPWSVDGAFRRPGRFDRVIFVAPPDEPARTDILKAMLKEKPVGNVDAEKVAKSTANFSGADLSAVVDIAVEYKLEDSMRTGQVQPLDTKDLLKAAKQHKPTTQEWFASARNYALYANEAGLYDDILEYMKIKK